MDFDEYADVYTQEIERVVGFSGRDHDFFLGAKIRHLLSLARARGHEVGRSVALDLGCGTGGGSSLLAPHVRLLCASDVAFAPLVKARERAPDARLSRYDGRHLPFSDRAFDLVTAVCVLHHVPEVEWLPLLVEMARVVRPGGMAVVFEHNPWNPLTRRVVARCPFDRDARLLRCGTTKRLMRQAGWDKVEHAYILFSPWQGRLWRGIEAALGWLPLGAQYWVAGHRPSERS